MRRDGDIRACFAHGGGNQQRCLHPTPDGPCQKLVRSGGDVQACFAHGGGKRRRCLHPTPDGPCQNLVVSGGEIKACFAHGGGKRRRCLHPTPDGPCQKLVVSGGEIKACAKHGGGKPRRCLHPTPDGPCQKQVVSGGEVRACIKHGGGKRLRCLHPTPDGPCQNGAVGGGEVRACKKHGGGKRCLHPTPNGPCQKLALCGEACTEHGGGVRCTSEACATLEPPPSAGYRSPEDQPLCWGCFTAQYPERAKLKVRKEHLLLAELQRRLPWLGEKAEQLIWDCPVPGGCTLKRPDMLYRFEDRFVQVEVDEEGHEDLSCADEDSRLELIAADGRGWSSDSTRTRSGSSSAAAGKTASKASVWATQTPSTPSLILPRPRWRPS